MLTDQEVLVFKTFSVQLECQLKCHPQLKTTKPSLYVEIPRNLVMHLHLFMRKLTVSSVLKSLHPHGYIASSSDDKDKTLRKLSKIWTTKLVLFFYIICNLSLISVLDNKSFGSQFLDSCKCT